MSTWFSGLEARFHGRSREGIASRMSPTDSASLTVLFPAEYRAVFVFARVGYCRVTFLRVRQRPLMPGLIRSLRRGTSAPFRATAIRL